MTPPEGKTTAGSKVLPALVGQVALAVPLLALERRMRRTGGPGIIGFELAGTPERSRRIMRTWGPDGRAAARASLLLDFPYLVTYSVLQHAACLAAGRALARAGQSEAARLAAPIAAAQVAAGAFDAAENSALLGVLTGRGSRLPRVAASCAQAKFGLLICGWVYGATGLIAHLAGRRRPTSVAPAHSDL